MAFDKIIPLNIKNAGLKFYGSAFFTTVMIYSGNPQIF